MEFRGEFVKTLFERDEFAIRRFVSAEPVTFPDNSTGTQFSVKGILSGTGLEVKLEGEWDSSPYVTKRGRKEYTFNASLCSEIKSRNEIGIKKYLVTISGIGTASADRIYQHFGSDTFKILDQNIDRLLEVKGIGEKTFKIASEDYLSRGAAKELYAYLIPFGVQNRKISLLYKKYGDSALDEVRSNPHELFLNNLLSFEIAEKIARKNNLDSLSLSRMKSCIVYVLYQAELKGHTFTSWKDLLNKTYVLLGVDMLSKEERIPIANKIRSAAKQIDKRMIACETLLKNDSPIFYRYNTGNAEYVSAEEIRRIVRGTKVDNKDYTSDILEAEKALGVLLSPEQEDAVRTVMNSPISVVTGGPGTGKTSFQKVLFYVFEKHNPGCNILLGAPTGRAARRMTESSGLPAKTLHQILRLSATDDGDLMQFSESKVVIDSDLFVVDEVSMLDIFLCEKLFSAIEAGKTKVVCVGDIYQLPSVGCGAVLKSLIDSGEIPTITFTKIFRQDGNSSIAINAARINHGKKDMEYDNSFQFIPSNDSKGIVDEVKRQYEAALKEYGCDETIVLTPYRRKTETGVNELNPVLKEIVNPLPKNTDRSNKVDKMNLYVGDKVMFTKNVGDLTNGDIGYIKSINCIDKSQIVTVDFGEDRVVDLMGSELNNLVQAYACTIHKSQGSEYKCCIIVIDPKHEILLKRNLVYTAITRAKEKVILIGDINAYTQSIDKEDTSTRNSQLDDLIIKAMSE